MYSIYVDDIRIPTKKFDVICRTTKEAMKEFRHKYKEGQRSFLLDLDHDSGTNAPGGDFINILKEIEEYVYIGKMKDLNINIHLHSGNIVGIENMRQIISHNDYMHEIF